MCVCLILIFYLLFDLLISTYKDYLFSRYGNYLFFQYLINFVESYPFTCFRGSSVKCPLVIFIGLCRLLKELVS